MLKKGNKAQLKKQQEEKYVSYWGSDKVEPYNALKDKHASYYFGSQGLKKHLKKIRKAVEFQYSGLTKTKYSEMIENKLGQLKQTDKRTEIAKIQPYEITLKASSIEKLHEKKNYISQKSEKSHHLGSERHKTQSRKFELYNQDKEVTKFTKKLQPLNQSSEKQEKTKKRKNSLSKKSYSIAARQYKTIDHKPESQQASFKLRLKSNPLNQKRAEQIQKFQKKEIKHQDFLNFLKKKHEDLLKFQQDFKEEHSLNRQQENV